MQMSEWHALENTSAKLTLLPLRDHAGTAPARMLAPAPTSAWLPHAPACSQPAAVELLKAGQHRFGITHAVANGGIRHGRLYSNTSTAGAAPSGEVEAPPQALQSLPEVSTCALLLR